MQLDLVHVPFGRRLSRHMVYEETDNGGNGWDKGLYLALAGETVAMFGRGASGPKGFLKIVPVFEGKTLDYTYKADVGSISINTEKGSIVIAFDGAKNLRIAGKGIGLRFDGRVSFGENVYQKKHGIEFLKAGGIYLIKALKGDMSLDSHWDLKALHATNPTIYITPDKNTEFELLISDTTLALDIDPLSESIEAAAKETEKDFEDFKKGLVKAADKYADLYNLAAYAYWIGLYDNGLACFNKMNDQKFYSLEVPVSALAYADAEKAAEILLAQLENLTPMGLVPNWFNGKAKLTEAVLPLYAISLGRIIADGGLTKLSKNTLNSLYEKVSAAVGWWLNKRTNEDGLSFYAFRHECGFTKYASFACDTPAAGAELAALLVMACSSLAVLATVLEKSDEASAWADKTEKQLSNVAEKLWVEGGFVNINIATGERCKAEGIISLFPLYISRLLPKEITDTLIKKAENVDFGTIDIIPAALIILGLFFADKKAAEKAAEKLIESCKTGGINDKRGKDLAAGTFYNHNACAALLAVLSCMSKE